MMNWPGVSAYFIISSASIWCGVVFRQFYVLSVALSIFASCRYPVRLLAL